MQERGITAHSTPPWRLKPRLTQHKVHLRGLGPSLLSTLNSQLSTLNPSLYGL